MDEPCHQDDCQDDQHEPYEEQHDAGNSVSGYGLGSHGRQLPSETRFIRYVLALVDRLWHAGLAMHGAYPASRSRIICVTMRRWAAAEGSLRAQVMSGLVVAHRAAMCSTARSRTSAG